MAAKNLPVINSNLASVRVQIGTRINKVGSNLGCYQRGIMSLTVYPADQLDTNDKQLSTIWRNILRTGTILSERSAIKEHTGCLGSFVPSGETLTNIKPTAPTNIRGVCEGSNTKKHESRKKVSVVQSSSIVKGSVLQAKQQLFTTQ